MKIQLVRKKITPKRHHFLQFRADKDNAIYMMHFNNGKNSGLSRLIVEGQRERLISPEEIPADIASAVDIELQKILKQYPPLPV